MEKGGWSGCLFGNVIELGESVGDTLTVSTGQVSPSLSIILNSVVDVVIVYPVSCYQFATGCGEYECFTDFKGVMWAAVIVAAMFCSYHLEHLWVLCVVVSQVHILHRSVGVIDEVEE